MEEIIQFWQALSKLQRFSFTSSPGARSKTLWQGSGQGFVTTESINTDQTYLLEEGVFTLENGTKLDIHNEWLWERTASTLLLSHVRQGRDRPVPLFELIPLAGTGHFETQLPHICGHDNYSATSTLCAHGVEIQWSISGPKKEEQLMYTYSY